MSFTPPTPFIFVRSLILNPRAMGALAPSSPKLSQLMASLVDPTNSSVLEIGAGTGAVTRALLARNVRPDRLIIIERDPSLATFLRHEFPGVRVRCGEAVHLSRILSDESIRRVDTVVSSLPLRNLPRVDRIKTVRAMVNALEHKGQLIQYTYFAGCPIPSNRLGLEAERLGRVWLNLPPASVWRFTVKRQFPAA
jgi:phosphatidylethanolamine/phosphatidyl-N-methylethanolamine N-methyltransferase